MGKCISNAFTDETLVEAYYSLVNELIRVGALICPCESLLLERHGIGPYFPLAMCYLEQFISQGPVKAFISTFSSAI